MHNTYYGITLGNHDIEANLNAYEIADLDYSHPYRY